MLRKFQLPPVPETRATLQVGLLLFGTTVKHRLLQSRCVCLFEHPQRCRSSKVSQSQLCQPAGRSISAFPRASSFAAPGAAGPGCGRVLSEGWGGVQPEPRWGPRPRSSGGGRGCRRWGASRGWDGVGMGRGTGWSGDGNRVGIRSGWAESGIGSSRDRARDRAGEGAEEELVTAWGSRARAGISAKSTKSPFQGRSTWRRPESRLPLLRRAPNSPKAPFLPLIPPTGP